MARLHRRQLVATVVLTVSGGIAEGTLTPECIGQALGCHIVHTTGTNSATIVIKDANGYDVLEGLGSVLGAGADLSLNADDIRGNPCHEELTATLSSGNNGDVFTIYLHILGDPGPRDNVA